MEVAKSRTRPGRDPAVFRIPGFPAILRDFDKIDIHFRVIFGTFQNPFGPAGSTRRVTVLKKCLELKPPKSALGCEFGVGGYVKLLQINSQKTDIIRWT